MAYSSKVVDKFEKTLKDPKAASVGRWKPGDEDYDKVGTGIVGAPACGDVMKLQIKCEDIEGEKRIVDAKFVNNPSKLIKDIGWYRVPTAKSIGNFQYYNGWIDAYPVGNLSLIHI